MKKSIENSLENTYTYQEYRDLITSLLAEGKSTGPEQSDYILNYSKLNNSRMKRLDKTTKISDETTQAIQKLATPQTWLVLTEGWCGDAAQNLPIIHKMAELNKNVNLKLILRDENLELMDLFLTNGGRSIPKLIALDKDNNVIDTWGPRPTIATKMVEEYKAKHGSLDADFKEDLQVWYNKDKGLSTQKDFFALVNSTL
jgi:hypothetical protein